MVVGNLLVISAGIGISPPEVNPWKNIPKTKSDVATRGAHPTNGTSAKQPAAPKLAVVESDVSSDH